MQAISIRVIGGPDKGKEAVFRSAEISIGRGPKSDFMLVDGLVSKLHGMILVSPQGVTFRDTQSRHGTIVQRSDRTLTLHDRNAPLETVLTGGAYLIMGETLLEVGIDAPPPVRSLTPGGMFFQHEWNEPPVEHSVSRPGERILSHKTEAAEAIAQRLIVSDPRIASLFRISRELNGVSTLGELLDKVCQASLEAFTAANFFAVSVPDPDAGDETTFTLLRSHERDSAELSARGISQGGVLLPSTLIRQVYETRESLIYLKESGDMAPSESMLSAGVEACLAVPLIGQKGILGVMQVDTRGMGGLFGKDDLDLFMILASQTALAMERIQLSNDLLEMFEGVVRLSVAAIDSRDPSTAGHSERVAKYAVHLAEQVNRGHGGSLHGLRFSSAEITELRYAALLHDFGKVGVRESVLTKGTRLSPERLEAIRERFEAARSSAIGQAYRDAVEAATRQSLDVATLRVRAENLAAHRIGVLQSAEQVILRYQPGKPLDEEARTAIGKVAQLSFVDSAGRVRPLLEELELVDMLIPAGTLNEREWEDMRSHAGKSYQFLCQIPWGPEFQRIPEFAWKHHEKLDGSGYPQGLGGEDLPPQVRILTIVDIYDAMTASDRVYRRAISQDEALGILYREAQQGLLDRDLVELLSGALREGFEVGDTLRISGN